MFFASWELVWQGGGIRSTQHESKALNSPHIKRMHMDSPYMKRIPCARFSEIPSFPKVGSDSLALQYMTGMRLVWGESFTNIIRFLWGEFSLTDWWCLACVLCGANSMLWIRVGWSESHPLATQAPSWPKTHHSCKYHFFYPFLVIFIFFCIIHIFFLLKE